MPSVSDIAESPWKSTTLNLNIVSLQLCLNREWRITFNKSLEYCGEKQNSRKQFLKTPINYTIIVSNFSINWNTFSFVRYVRNTFMDVSTKLLGSNWRGETFFSIHRFVWEDRKKKWNTCKFSFFGCISWWDVTKNPVFRTLLVCFCIYHVPFPPKRQKRHFTPYESHVRPLLKFCNHVVEDTSCWTVKILFERFQPSWISVTVRY